MTTMAYSGTPLSKKLGISSGTVILIVNSPKPYLEFFHEFPSNVQFSNTLELEVMVDFIHIFAAKELNLNLHFDTVKPRLKKNGSMWLSWPKKSSEIPTELDKTAIRKFGLANGLVDTKVAAIDSDWSGHKFVYRKSDR